MEIARWAEDYGVVWDRTHGPQSGPITPRINAVDRFNNEPLALNLQAAIVFAGIARETGDRLWAEKGKALATAAAMALHPVSGRPSVSLTPGVWGWDGIYKDSYGFMASHFCSGWSAKLFREYAAVSAGK